MGLTKYIQKRNFNATPEPGAVKKKSEKSLAFVVQRHYASRLHYDFRLEMEGVLKSWAVPKGPSMNPGDKRLAMMVEDHPYDYRKFAGTIPEGNYGAGEVEIWDEGTYSPLIENDKTTPEKELLNELKKGDLKFTLHGEQLKGAFALVKLKNAEQDNAWLLIKKKDELAVEKAYNAADHDSLVVKTKPKTKKPAPAKAKAQEKVILFRSIRSSIGRVNVKNYIKPMLAKKVDEPFDSNDWVFEIKWDGYRAIAETGKELKFYSRNGISFLNRYPGIEDELKSIKENLVLDGEVVAMDEKGVPSFQMMQNLDNQDTILIYYVFDILKKGKKDLTGLPLLERKEILKQSLPELSFIRYSDHIAGVGKQFFDLSKQRNLEGIMAKKADSTYSPGMRTGNWLKIKNHQGQEAVIAGFTAPRGSRKSFGALVLGVYEGKKLKYCGHTGTGFNDANLKDLHAKLMDIVQAESPFKDKIKTNMPVTWVKPILVCNVKYTEMTSDGIMRHPVYLGLREDKKPEEVVNEDKAIMKNGNKKTVAVKHPEETSRNDEKNYELKIGKHTVKLTNQDKIYFPDDKITKGDIVDYYQKVSQYILPYLKNRPQSLFRNPNGINGPGFFHKDAGDEGPDWLQSEIIYSDSTNKDIDYILCNDGATLAYLNNLGCIELNPWHSKVGALDKPDYFALDIDPSPKNSFDQVIEAALAVKEVLDRAGAKSYCKTSGATGLHIYVPLGAKYTYEQVKDFAQLIALIASELLPDFTSLVRSLNKRGDKIYMDYLQNRQGQTLASVYSVRPKPGATVSTPLLWEELKPGLSPSQFTIYTIHDRLKAKGDLFTPVLGKGIDLLKCIHNLSK